MSTIGDRIRQRRHELGLNQPELARKVGVSKVSVSQWEGNASGVSGKNLLALARAHDPYAFMDRKRPSD